MRFKTSLILIIILAFIIAATAVFISQNGFDIRISNPFVKTEKTAESTAVLKQVKEISRLNSIEFIYKTVFPYDLIRPGTDFRELVEDYRSGKKLDFNEVEMLSVYGIAAEAGIDLLKDEYSFAVITARVKAGYNFPDSIPEDSVLIDPENSSVSLMLPPVSITEVIIEDADSSVYNYPDIKISPEQWRTLTSIIARLVESEAKTRGILEKAEQRGELVIRELLLSAGFTEVYFQ